jgi:hypothetical protein
MTLARWVPSATLRPMKTNMIEKSKLYTARCVKAWDGDAFGNEWTCGAAVYRSEELGLVFDTTRVLFRVFEDDGKGNGSHLDSFETEEDARAYADLYVKFLDAGGYSDTPEAAAMCAFSKERSHYSLSDA